jgi:DNA-binding CsgD family transcriptional regulator
VETIAADREGGPDNPDGSPSLALRGRAILGDITPPTDSALIGRAEELRRLTALLDRAKQEQKAVALVSGDAGVGKTRLLSELTEKAADAGFRVLVGACMETGDVGLPYVPFVDAFRAIGNRPEEAQLAGALVSQVPNLGRLLPELGDERLSPSSQPDTFEQVELFGGIHSLLMRLSKLAPLLVVIEDIHWADRSTRHLLAFLVRSLRAGRVALVASYRSDDLHRRHPLRPWLTELVRMTSVERIELYPFDRDELTLYLESLVGGRVDPEAVDRILVRSEGNAFFSEELVAAGAISANVVLPEALADVMHERIETLSQPAQEIIKVASVSGRWVSHQLLLEASGGAEPEVESSLREAIAGQVLVADPETETYRFRHALLQEAVYGDLLPGERTRLHGTYARLLAESGPSAELAHHSLASHDLPGALSALVRAAADATAVSAPAEAHAHLAQAIELWDRVPDPERVAGVDRPTLLLRAANAAGNSGEFRHAVGFAREAVEAVDAGREPLRAAVAYERLGEYLYLTSGFEEGLEATRRAVELVPPDPPSALRALVTGALARALLGARRYDEARAWCDEALAMTKVVDAPEEETHALTTLAVLEMRLDNAEVARSLLRDARSRAADAGVRAQELRAQFNIGSLELDGGDLTAACDALDEAVELAERTGLAWSGSGLTAGALRLFAYYAAGRWEEAEQLVSALDERAAGAAVLSAAALFVEVGRGDPGADERLRRLEAHHEEDDWIAYLGGGCSTDLALWQGELGRARALSQETLALLDAADEAWELSAIWPATLGLAAEAELAEEARRRGDLTTVAEAEKVGEVLLERCRMAEQNARSVGRQIGPEALGWLARAEAEWSRLRGCADPDVWAASVEAFSYGYVYEEARSRWRLAETLLSSGRREEASEQARAAYGVAVQLRAEPLRRALEALARRGRLDLGGGVRHEGGAGFTPRELEVLRLVAEGRSNQQIADTLFISRKTASVHVSNILSKLGVGTRVEAAAAAHRLGLNGAGAGEP